MKFIRSVGFAWNGVKHGFKTQLNFRIHLAVLLLVISAGVFFKITSTECLFITGCVVLVLSLELLNTAIEYLCDVVTKEIHPGIKIVKDAAAAAVLLAAIGSVVIGCIIFLPKIIDLILS